MFNRFIVASVLLVSASGAFAKNDPLPTPLGDSLPVEIVVTQQELGVDVPASRGGQIALGGLLGALVDVAVDKSRANKGEDRVTRLRDMLLDYRFNDRFEQALRAKLPSPGLSPAPRISLRDGRPNAPIVIMAGGSRNDVGILPPVYAQNDVPAPQQGVLVITPRYAIDSDFEVLRVAMTVQFTDRSLKPNGKLKEVIRSARYYSFQFPMAHIGSNSPDQDAQRWLGMGKSKLQALLDQGITQVTDMVVYDFTAEGRLEAADSSKGKVRQVRVNDDWYWARSGKNGYMIRGDQRVGQGDNAATSVAATAPAPSPAVAVAADPAPTNAATTADASPPPANAPTTGAGPAAAETPAQQQ